MIKRTLAKRLPDHDARAKAFDTLRNNTYPVDPNFRWVCQDTRIMRPQEMTTYHLFNSLKMIWNENCPPECIIEPHNPYPSVKRWPRDAKRRSIQNLFNELMNRPDRTRGHNEALVRMAEHLKRRLLEG